MTRLLSAISALGLWLCSSLTSYANVFDTYGQGASTVAVGNATTAGGPTAYAAYTNPALLTLSSRSEISSSVMWTQFRLGRLPEAPGGRLPQDQFSADKAEDLRGGSLGINLKLHDRLHFGLATYMPQGNFGRVKGLSPYQTSYLRYSELQQKPAAYTAMALQLPAGLSLGAGAYYSLKAKGLLQVSLSKRESEGRFDLVMEPVIVPYGGFLWTNQTFSIGGFYRAAQETESEIQSTFAFSTDEATLPFDATTSLVPFYDPSVLRFGFAYNSGPLQLYASIEQARWSQFKAPQVTITGNDVAALSEELASRDAGLRDTYAYRLGTSFPFQLSAVSSLDLKAGVELHTSANETSERSTLIDPERRSLAFGGSWTLVLDDAGRRLGWEAAYQYSSLRPLSSTTPKGSAVNLDGNKTIHTVVGGVSYAL
jgi:long-subunit fatty acid transport protein